MEKKNSTAQNKGIVYIVAVVMLVTVIVIAVVSAIGTANRTDSKIGVGTEDAIITGSKRTDTQKNTGDSTTKDTEAKDKTTNTVKDDTDNSTDVSAPLEFCLPVRGYISKDYSMDMPVYSLTMNDYRAHCGLDIQATVGSAVSVVASGEITNRYTDPFMGICVEVSHGGGLVSRYMNLGPEYPKDAEVGCKVYGGQTIGCVGESAALEAADTSHLHFEMLKDGKHANPLGYIDIEPMSDEYKE